MDFTRQPIIESIITPREGYRIVVRSSKNAGHEEYFLDALEIISFGNTTFYRSIEKPKPFLVPAADYEVLEVREPRVLLKAPVIEGSLKVNSSREMPFSARLAKEVPAVKEVFTQEEKPVVRHDEKSIAVPRVFQELDKEPSPIQENEDVLSTISPAVGTGQDKKRDRRGRLRKRKGGREESQESSLKQATFLKDDAPASPTSFQAEEKKEEPRAKEVTGSYTATLLPPPPTLIRDDIERLRKDDSFKGAFFVKDEKPCEGENGGDEAPTIQDRRMFDEDDTDEVSSDAYKATPSKTTSKEFLREPFWIPSSKGEADSKSSTPPEA